MSTSASDTVHAAAAALSDMQLSSNDSKAENDATAPAAASTTAAAPAAGGSTKKGKKAAAADASATSASSATSGAAGAGAGAATTTAAASGEGQKKKKQIEAYHYTNTTPPGEKKDTSTEMLAAYHPQAVEAAWDAWWSASGFYTPDAAAAQAAGPEGRFVMVIPPPNVTGSLHLGHALTDSVEDCLARWHRMQGRPTLWLPGLDHAGIATQAVVERRLQKERGISRHDLGREPFVEEVWKWKEASGGKITDQMRHLGTSTDWSRCRFTMDPQMSTAVVEAFVRMYESGLIYRDTRLVNWCCRLNTAISDIEVDYIDIEKRVRRAVPGHDPNKTYEFGTLTSFAYKVVDSPTGEEIVVATTRPETMLGDSAVAVHPTDARYTHLHGKLLQHPFFPDRQIPVITDAELVDPTFGTGAVKITPAHDPNDYKCGKKHSLQFITIFNDDGTVNANGGQFAGMMRFDARDAVVKALNEKGLFRGKVDNKMRLGVCSRSGDVIEPLIKPQWYVRCGGMAKAAADAVRSGELQLIPDFHQSTWFHYLDNIQDWCISRQLWWGHRIPAYLVQIRGAAQADSADVANWVVGRTREEALARAITKTGRTEAEIELLQDDDVLDTWFSSGLFPFATVGWPNTEHPDYKAFYPNTLLETGHDILFFWVARMVMMGITLTGQLPFKQVYLHAMVRDKYGRKMSKSLGNVIDPLEVIHGCGLEALHQKVRDGNLPPKEVDIAIKGQKLDYPDGIPECGSDALRFGLLAYTLQGRDINLDTQRVVGYRQFCNKLWNATRFAMLNFPPGEYTPAPLLDMIDELTTTPHLAPRDRWILARLNNCIRTVTTALGEFSFGAATSSLYSFWWYELCDYYLELIKPVMLGDATAATSAGGDTALAARLSRNVLYVCLDHGLRLLHPFMPFITEELWQRLPGRGGPWRADGSVPSPVSIMISSWPTPLPNCDRPEVESAFETFQAAVRAARSLRSDADIAPSREVTVYMVADATARPAIETHQRDIMTLARAKTLRIVESMSEVEDGCSAYVVDDHLTANLLLKGLIDPETEVQRVNRRIANIEKQLYSLNQRMSIPNYTEKVPTEVQAENAENLKSTTTQLNALQALRDKYNSWRTEAPVAATSDATNSATATSTSAPTATETSS